ncbi:hypothetical protein [Ideonella sp. A 288]|uniref:hypothetical protein n=1 Tax=Ideonella sp. A 288 TaxID=1962181 RepID=UPI000B4B3D34|nr:hypothetical protein [Ideonella sp. A 288]
MSDVNSVSFFSLPEFEFSPTVVFGIHEGLRIALPEDERANLPTPKVLLSMTQRARDIAELAEGVRITGYGEMLVLRVLHPKVEWGPIEPGFFDTLNENGESLVCLADPKTDEPLPVPDLLIQFVTCALPLQLNLRTPISRLVAYMVATRDLGLESDIHRPFAEPEDLDSKHSPRGTPQEALQLTRLLARNCPSTQHLAGFLQHLHSWLETKDETVSTTAALLLHLRTEDPFAIWRNAAV